MTEAFITTLRQFIARKEYPSLIWSDNSSNFIGAKSWVEVAAWVSCSSEYSRHHLSILFQFEHWVAFHTRTGLHFGGLWEAVDNVKSAKTHLKRVIGDTKLTFEEMVTLLTQIEPCLNSRPLVAINTDDDGTEAFTSGHSLIGQPLFSSGLHTLISYWIPPSAMATV